MQAMKMVHKQGLQDQLLCSAFFINIIAAQKMPESLINNMQEVLTSKSASSVSCRLTQA